LPACATTTFAKRCLELLSEGLQPALKPLIEQIAEISARIAIFDQMIQRLVKTGFPEMQMLVQVPGVGELTASTFVLTLGEKGRFRNNRDVGGYLGLRPRRDQSGEHDPQLGITKAGNGYLRSLLVECANHILGPFGKDSALRRWGTNLAARRGKNARKKALIAMARKLAILLYKLWTTQEKYEPFYGQQVA
jgi:transposase